MRLIKEAPAILFTSLPLIAGFAISLQGALNSKVAKNLGLLEVVISVHLFGLLTSLIIHFIFGSRNIEFFFKVDLNLLIAGLCGVLITFCLALSFIKLGALLTVMISLATQLIVTKVLEHYGFLSLNKIPINAMQVLAIIVMIFGVIIYQKSY